MEARDEENFKRLKVWVKKSLLLTSVFMSKENSLMQLDFEEIPQLCERLVQIYMNNGGNLMSVISLKTEIARLISSRSTFGQRSSMSNFSPMELYELDYRPPPQLPFITEETEV